MRVHTRTHASCTELCVWLFVEPCFCGLQVRALKQAIGHSRIYIAQPHIHHHITARSPSRAASAAAHTQSHLHYTAAYTSPQVRASKQAIGLETKPSEVATGRFSRWQEALGLAQQVTHVYAAICSCVCCCVRTPSCTCCHAVVYALLRLYLLLCRHALAAMHLLLCAPVYSGAGACPGPGDWEAALYVCLICPASALQVHARDPADWEARLLLASIYYARRADPPRALGLLETMLSGGQQGAHHVSMGRGVVRRRHPALYMCLATPRQSP